MPSPVFRPLLRDLAVLHGLARFALLLLGLAPLPAAATQPVAIAAAPRLEFSAAELAMAEALAGDPDLAAAYGERGLEPIFTGPAARPRRVALRDAVQQAPAHGLPPERYRPGHLAQLADGPAEGPQAELEMARIFAMWVRDVSAGILDPRRVNPGIKRTAEGADVARLLAEFARASDPAAVLAQAPPRDPRYLALQRALAEARSLVAPAGTPLVPVGVWRPGAADPAVAALRTRLSAVGFATPPTAEPAFYDEGLAAAVAAFQTAAGLPEDGVAGPQTLDRLNAGSPPAARAILVAMERWRWLPDDLGRRHIWVNLPEYSGRLVEDGEVTLETRVVIGKNDPDLRTPEFSDRMEYMVANPRWNVPRSITVREYLPRLQKNRNAAGHLQIVDSRGRVVDRGSIDFSRYSAANFPYRMQQKPSEDNALGIVKFMFPNQWNIYLHDTPSKHLFREARRAYSHGCIRVADPVDLARALLRPQVADPAASFSRALQAGGERYLTLDEPVPVHLVYFTTLPDADGRLRRFADVYGRDAEVWAALEAAMAPPPPAPTGLESIVASE